MGNIILENRRRLWVVSIEPVENRIDVLRPIRREVEGHTTHGDVRVEMMHGKVVVNTNTSGRVRSFKS